MVNSNQLKKNSIYFPSQTSEIQCGIVNQICILYLYTTADLMSFFLCVLHIYLVDNILPVLDEGESAPTAVCVLSEGEGSCSSPQIQLPQSFSDRHLRLSTTVQILYQCAPHAHTKNTRLCISHIGFCVWTARLPHYISNTSLKSANMPTFSKKPGRLTFLSFES